MEHERTPRSEGDTPDQLDSADTSSDKKSNKKSDKSKKAGAFQPLSAEPKERPAEKPSFSFRDMLAADESPQASSSDKSDTLPKDEAMSEGSDISEPTATTESAETTEPIDREQTPEERELTQEMVDEQLAELEKEFENATDIADALAALNAIVYQEEVAEGRSPEAAADAVIGELDETMNLPDEAFDDDFDEGYLDIDVPDDISQLNKMPPADDFEVPDDIGQLESLSPAVEQPDAERLGSESAPQSSDSDPAQPIKSPYAPNQAPNTNNALPPTPLNPTTQHGGSGRHGGPPPPRSPFMAASGANGGGANTRYHLLNAQNYQNYMMINQHQANLAPSPNKYMRGRYERDGGIYLGLLAGYLLGRWRGKRKVRRQLEPQLKQKDQQLQEARRENEALKKRLIQGQQKVQTYTREQVTQNPDKAAARMIAHLDHKRQQDKVGTPTPLSHAEKPTNPAISEQPPVHMERPFIYQERTAQNTNRSESLDSSGSVTADRLPRSREKLPAAAKLENVATMRLPEVLEVAQHIKVEGVSAAALYQQERLDEAALRRVVTERAHGGNPERALVVEIKTAEARAVTPEQMGFKRQQTHQVSGGGGSVSGDNHASAGSSVSPVFSHLSPANDPKITTTLTPPKRHSRTPKVAIGAVAAAGAVLALLFLL